jgi:hypothetical protein
VRNHAGQQRLRCQQVSSNELKPSLLKYKFKQKGSEKTIKLNESQAAKGQVAEIKSELK